MSASTLHDNPFLQSSYNTPHNAVPFDRIAIELYEPAIMEGMRRERDEIDHIVGNPDAPTFENTIVALEKSGRLLDDVTTVFYNLQSAETCDELDALGQKMAPLLSKHSSDIMLNERLFDRIRQVYDHRPDALDIEETQLLEQTYEGFVRSGALLDKKGKERLRTLNEEISVLTLQFSQNNLKETNAFILHITDGEQLKGLPQRQCELAAETAREKGLEGWVITLHAPSYSPFMTHADDRTLRKRLYMAQNTKSTHNNEFCNFNTVKRLVNLRREKAQLLGYSTYADFVLKRRMAQNTGNVFRLLNRLTDAYLPPAKKEVAEIERLAKELEGDDFSLQPWDFAYYAHKLKLRKYNIDAEMLRPYLELSKVKQGVFGLATRLYGIAFRPTSDIPVYHPDVCAYEVFDADGSFLAILYADFHPRAGKQSGAWETQYRGQWTDGDGNHRPLVSITMNLSKPTSTQPALLTLGEVETFLHEFGHALHSIFANTRFRSLSGTNVFWDFVELPSQLMENFATEKEFLRTFAFHYQTGEPLPDELIDRIRESRNFNAAYACMRQVGFGLLDMAYYTLSVPFDKDIVPFEKEAMRKAAVVPQLNDTCMSVQFGHIMAGGYSAGYYSYKWAEVLDADAFALFRKKGIFSRNVAQSFRDNVLSRGGTEHPMTLYKRFRGKEPSIEHLLRRDGLEPCAGTSDPNV